MIDVLPTSTHANGDTRLTSSLQGDGKSRGKNQTSRQWLLGDQRILEDEFHHLGILRLVEAHSSH